MIITWANTKRIIFLESQVKFHLAHIGLITATCVEWRNRLNRTCQTKWSNLKDVKKKHIVAQKKLRNRYERETKWLTSMSLEKVIAPFLRLWDSSVSRWEALSTTENVVNLPRSRRPNYQLQNESKIVLMTHPGGRKRNQNNISAFRMGLSNIRPGWRGGAKTCWTFNFFLILLLVLQLKLPLKSLPV